MAEKTSFKGGLDLKFFAEAEFESIEHLDPSEKASRIGRNALRILMMGWQPSWTQLISWSVIKAVFIYRDPNLLKELRFAFQQGFETLFTQLKGQSFTPLQNEQIQLYLSNCLGLLPLSDLTPYESIKIPQLIDGQWEMIEYSITPIELTQDQYNKGNLLRDKDRVFAYGLESIINKKAQSHLILMGTTYPAGQGFIPQIDTDLRGFETVGYSLYQSGRKNIEKWILNQHEKIQVCGISLGGSLSLLLALDMGQYLSRVDALNPAGLHERQNKEMHDQWDQLVAKPKVVIQKQGNDPVSIFGIWKKEWDILQVIPPEDKRGPNPFCDHFLNYAGFAGTEFTYSDAEEENEKRKLRNFWFYSFGRTVLYYAAIAPYNYVIRPAIYFIYNNASNISLALVPVLTIGIVLGLSVAGLLPGFLLMSSLALLASVSSLFILYRNLNGMSSEKEYISDMELMRKNMAKLHNPDLPRNPEMDMYNKENKISVELTYREINTYYQVMRCLVKQKEFLTSEEKPENELNGMSKKELLSASQNPELADKSVMLTTTKAKAVYIKHALTLVDKIGMENKAVLKSALEEEYRHYCLGKHN